MSQDQTPPAPAPPIEGRSGAHRSAMQYSDLDLRAAVSAGVIEAADLDRLVTFLATRRSAVVPASTFDAAHLLWYAGALIVIGAVGLFSTLAFSAMGGQALTACAVVYATVFMIAGHNLWHRKNLKTGCGRRMLAENGLRRTTFPSGLPFNTDTCRQNS